jgi:hypothetical protein
MQLIQRGNECPGVVVGYQSFKIKGGKLHLHFGQLTVRFSSDLLKKPAALQGVFIKQDSYLIDLFYFSFVFGSSPVRILARTNANHLSNTKTLFSSQRDFCLNLSKTVKSSKRFPCIFLASTVIQED